MFHPFFLVTRLLSKVIEKEQEPPFFSLALSFATPRLGHNDAIDASAACTAGGRPLPHVLSIRLGSWW